MKLLAVPVLSLAVLFASGCKPDPAIRRPAVVDQPTPKEPPPTRDKPAADQQTPTKVN